MKKLLKLWLVAGLMLAQLTHAEENIFYTAAHWWLNFSRHSAAIIGPLAAAGRFLYFKHTMTQLPDAPEAVLLFCHNKLTQHMIDPDTIIIKTRDNCSFMETFPGAIIFNPTLAQQLHSALADPSAPESIHVIGICSTFLDHEIAHLKNHDVVKGIAILTGTTLTTYLASSYLIETEYLKPWFKKPETIKEFFISWGAYSVLAGINHTIIKNITQWYHKNGEYNADAYAIAHAENPTALRAAADCLEKIDNCIIDFICSDEQPNPDLAAIQRIYLNFMRTMLKFQYQQENPQEDFRTWVQKQTGMLEDMLNIADPAHPRAHIRAEIMRKAADALEQQQQLPAPC